MVSWGAEPGRVAEPPRIAEAGREALRDAPGVPGWLLVTLSARADAA